MGADRRKGGDNVRDIIAVTSGSPQGSSRVTLGRLSVTCRRHVPVVYSSPRSLRPHLPKDSSLTNLSCSTFPQSCLCCPLSAKSLLHSNPFYFFLEGQLASKTRLFVYIHHSFLKFCDDLNGNPMDTLWIAVVLRQEGPFDNKRF